jgi:lipopolysaccharide export system protein LptA
VADDRGTLTAETLTGRFSEENKVELIEARRDVRIASGERTATAESAVYSLQDGAIQLDGGARLAEGGNRLSGERIKFWIKGSRRMICEPGAQLEITQASDLATEGFPEGGGTTVIRSERLVYDEEQSLARFEGNVRMRNPRAALNCEQIRLYLKEDNKIDWIEALHGVIIQSEDRKALAERAIYYADDERFVLEGNPTIRVDRHVMTGDRIIFRYGTEHMVCEPNARALLYLDEEMKAKFLQDLKD